MDHIAISKIRIDGGTQPRSEIDGHIVRSYAEDLENGATFPAVVVFYDGDEYWLADGFHRLKAFREAGKTGIPVQIMQGGQRDAVLYSVGANADHGLRRTNADKRRAVQRMLDDPEWSRWSDREIARRCRVGHALVSNMRGESSVHDGQIEDQQPSTRTVTRSGTTYKQDTSNIGRPNPREVQPEDEGADDPDETPHSLAVSIADQAIRHLEKMHRKDPNRLREIARVRDWCDEQVQGRKKQRGKARTSSVVDRGLQH